MLNTYMKVPIHCDSLLVHHYLQLESFDLARDVLCEKRERVGMRADFIDGKTLRYATKYDKSERAGAQYLKFGCNLTLSITSVELDRILGENLTVLGPSFRSIKYLVPRMKSSTSPNFKIGSAEEKC